VPTFSSDAGSHPGLDLLAAAALVGRALGVPAGASIHGHSVSKALLSEAGQYYPAASISTKIVKHILDLEFVEMAEISTDDNIRGASRPNSATRPPITRISVGGTLLADGSHPDVTLPREGPRAICLPGLNGKG